MALIPLVFRNWWGDNLNEQLRPSQLLDKYTDLFPEDILGIINCDPKQDIKQKRARPCSSGGDENTKRSITKKSQDEFQITVDVQRFKPEEISVKVVDGGCITVEGKHEEGEEEDESGGVFRRFVRHYQLPEGIDERKLQTSFSSDGVLTISVQNFPLPAPKMVPTIPITWAMGSTENKLEKTNDPVVEAMDE